MSAETDTTFNTKYVEQPEIKENENNDHISVPSFNRQYTVNKIGDDDVLPSPYAKNWRQIIKYHIESFLAIHPRIYALYLLVLATWPRFLVIVDMYTDSQIAYELYQGNQRIWFMLSCLFITTPFILVWSASLRFIQLYVSNFFDKNNKLSLQWLVNIGLMIYMFAPIGSICIALAEVFWVIVDVLYGVKAFIFGTGLIDTANREIQAIKSYRRTVEVFAESVPQTLLQLYIFIRLTILSDSGENVLYQGVTKDSLYLSLVVSLINLCYNFYKFKSEALINGMVWSEYALSVLQLAEIPTIKLVPKLHAIKKGYIEEVNFSGFKFDNESLTPLVSAINSIECRLKRIKMSIASLGKLDNSSCKLLGNLLYNTGVQVLVSRTSSLLGLKQLFESIDVNHKGYLEENEFLSAIKTLNCSIQNVPKKQQQRIFKRLAIRTPKKRDKVYFYDFFKKAASVTESSGCYLTLIDNPMHFIFQRIKQMIESNEKEQDDVIKYFDKLYSFCDGLFLLKQTDLIINSHVFYPIIDVFSLQNVSNYPKYSTFVLKLFDKLLSRKDIFDSKFFLQRNNLFKHPDIEENSNIHQNAIKLIENLKNAGVTGCNIFEYCFICKPECKLFTRLFNAWLEQLDDETCAACDEIFNQNGELYILFSDTNGFHVKDSAGHTPLYYAAKYGQHRVISFFSKFMSTISIQNNEQYQWSQSQEYLHVIVHALLKTSTQNPTTDIFESFISSDKFDLNYVCKGKHLADFILLYRSAASKNKDYLLKCFMALEKCDDNFMNLVDMQQNNILHYAAFLNDIEVTQLIIDLVGSKSKDKLRQLLNSPNKQSRTPLANAVLNNCSEIAKILILLHEQEVDYNIFIEKFKLPATQTEIINKWIKCLFELITITNGLILNHIETNIKEDIYTAIDVIHRRIIRETSIKHHIINSKYDVIKNNEYASLIQNITHIRQDLNVHINSNVLVEEKMDEIYHPDTDVQSVYSNASSIKQEAGKLQKSQKKWYLKTINSRENSCIGLKNISLKDAVILGFMFDFLANVFQAFLWICFAGIDMHHEVSMKNNLCYTFCGIWVAILIANVLSMFAVSNAHKLLIIIKLILILCSLIFCWFSLFVAIENTNRELFHSILYALMVLNTLVAIFEFRDVYNIYKWIKYYENGGLYKGEIKYMKEEEIMESFYKIIDMENDKKINGKYCKVILVLDKEHYRINLISDIWSVGPRIIHRSNLKRVSDKQVFVNKLKQKWKANIKKNDENESHSQNQLLEYEQAISESMQTYQMEQNQRKYMDDLQKSKQLSLMEQQNTQLNHGTNDHDFVLDGDLFVFGDHFYV